MLNKPTVLVRDGGIGKDLLQQCVSALRKLTFRAKDLGGCINTCDTFKFVPAKGAKTLLPHLGVDAFSLRLAFIFGLKRDAVIVEHALDDVCTVKDPPPLLGCPFTTRSRLCFGLRAQRVIQACNLNWCRSRQTVLGHAVCEDTNLIDLVGVARDFFQCRSALRSLLPHAVNLGLDRLVREHWGFCGRTGGRSFRRHRDEVHILVVELRRFVQHQHTCDALFFRNARPTQAIPLPLDIVFRAVWVAQRHAVVERRRDVFDEAANVQIR